MQVLMVVSTGEAQPWGPGPATATSAEDQTAIASFNDWCEQYQYIKYVARRDSQANKRINFIEAAHPRIATSCAAYIRKQIAKKEDPTSAFVALMVLGVLVAALLILGFRRKWRPG